MGQSIREKLVALEKEHRLVTENMFHSVWMIDATTLKYEYISPSIGDLGGYTASELVGQPVFIELAPDSLKETIGLLKEELMDFKRGKRETKSFELELVHKHGRKYWVEITAKFAEDQNGVIKIVGVTRDITARKAAELQLDEQNRKLIEALEERERLLKEIKVLRGLLPICSGCKRIRDDHGKWWPLDLYVKKHTDADLTHTICQDCKAIFYPDLKK